MVGTDGLDPPLNSIENYRFSGGYGGRDVEGEFRTDDEGVVVQQYRRWAQCQLFASQNSRDRMPSIFDQ